MFENNFRGLIHSQMDAGCKDDAIRTCTSAINLAKKRAPSKLMEVLKLQVLYMWQSRVENDHYSVRKLLRITRSKFW